MSKDISTIVGETAGAISVCWTPKPTGVFDSEKASEYLNKALDDIDAVTADIYSQGYNDAYSEIVLELDKFGETCANLDKPEAGKAYFRLLNTIKKRGQR